MTQLHCDTCQARFLTRWELEEHIKEERIKEKQVALDSALMRTTQPPDQQPVPEVARLLDEDIIKAVPIVSARQDTFEWSDLRDVADAATEKAWHSRDAEVAAKEADVLEFQETVVRLVNEVADYGNRLMMSSETNGLLAAKVAELQRRLGELQQEVDKVDNELERDSAREQVRALIEAVVYRRDWEARSDAAGDCDNCYGDSGPYIEYCNEHYPDKLLDAALGQGRA